MNFKGLLSKRVKLALQLLISAGLIAFILRQIDLGQARALLPGGAGLPWLLGAALLFNLSRVAGALRLNVYQRNAGIALGEAENLKLYYAGMFLNMFLPGGIGGDGYKVLVLHRREAAPVKSLVLIMLNDRASGLLVLLMLLCLFAPLLALPWEKGVVLLLAVAGAAALAGIFVAWHRLLLKMTGAGMASAFGYGMAVQLLQLGCMALLLVCLRVAPADFLAYLAIFLLSSVASVLPLSFGGLGAREVTFFYGLDLLGLDPTQGVLAASGFFLVTLVSSLPGAFFLAGFAGRPENRDGSGSGRALMRD